MNRLKELKTNIPFVKREFDRTINTIASWGNTFSSEMEFSLTKELQNAEGAADRMATQKMNTLQGSFLKLTSIIESRTIEAFQSIAPSMKIAVDAFANVLSKAEEKTKSFNSSLLIK